MIQRERRFLLSIQLLFDVLLVMGAWLISYPIRFHSGLFALRIDHVPGFGRFALLSILVLLVWAAHIRFSSLFQEKTVPGIAREILQVLRVHSLAFVTFVVIVFFIGSYRPSRIVFAVFFVLSSCAIVGAHLLFRRALIARRKRGIGLSRVLIVGAGDLAVQVANRISSHPELGLTLVGFLSEQADAEKTEIEGIPILGTTDQVSQLVSEHKIDQVFVALPLSAADRLAKVVNNVSDEMVDVKVVPDLIQYVTLRAGVEEFDGLPIISLKDNPIAGWNAVGKRLFDVGFTLAAAPFLILACVILAIAVKLSSPGPVLYKQKRMGLDGRTFKIYKFRSMAMDAEKATGAVWAVEGDSRRTWLGTFMRKANLDELPQFYNILQGRMSIVGPRPERPEFIEKFRGEIPKYMLRHKVKAGLTGWAQVNGWRGNTDLGKRIEYDLYYIQNWSMALDLYIIGLTLTRSFSDKNAY
jgi:Undecaprenyl-phosphate glucose phosphotransferase